MEAQSGANLTSVTMNSQSRELKTSGIADHNATTNPPPTGGGSEAGAQESPSMSDVELEYHLIKANAKQCLTTLPKKDQDMTLLENGEEHLVS